MSEHQVAVVGSLAPLVGTLGPSAQRPADRIAGRGPVSPGYAG